MEETFNNLKGYNSISAGVKNSKLSNVFKGDTKDIIYCISEILRYPTYIKNEKWLYSAEYRNKINYIISLYKKLLSEIVFKSDTFSKCVDYFHRLRNYYYDNVSIYNQDEKDSEIYYLAVDKIINDITIGMLNFIGNEQYELLNKEDSKYMDISNISHDLKTPINIILCSNQMTNRFSSDLSKLDKYNSIIKNNCFRLLKMVDNIIDTVKEQSGELTLNPCNIDIVFLINDIAKTVTDYISSKNINFKYICNLGKNVITMDCDKTERIVLNLLSNAIKFTKPNGLIILKLDKSKEYIRITVKDNGSGIAKDELKNIFKRYYQINNEDCAKGRGIGLSLVKAFVELMKGKIEIESVLGEGTEFRVYIPDYIDTTKECLNQANYYNNNQLIIDKEFSEL